MAVATQNSGRCEPRPLLVDRKAVMSMTCLSRSTIDRLEVEGRFPRRVRLGHRLALWKADEIAEWVRALEYA